MRNWNPHAKISFLGIYTKALKQVFKQKLIYECS